jgi:hypothetical protein
MAAVTKIGSDIVVSNVCNPVGYIIGCTRLRSALPEGIFRPASVGENELMFIRDFGVRTLDGLFLVPHSFSHDPEASFKALQPETGSHFIDSKYRCIGSGLDPESCAIVSSELPGPFIQGKSAVEGGNCFLFKNSEDLPTALVGMNSLILTLLALREHKEFAPLIHELKERIETPSAWAYRMARNWKLYEKRIPYEKELTKLDSLIEFYLKLNDLPRLTQFHQKKACILSEKSAQCGTDTAYRVAIKSPVIEKDDDLAKQFEAELAFSKKLIADELGVPLDRIGFLAQKAFHIDLELFVAKGKVYLDEKGVRQNREIIQNLGCEVNFVPGVLETPGQDTINFMNCVVLGDRLMTNGASARHHYMQAQFEAAIRAVDPSLKVSFIGNGFLSQVLSENRGGLHCLTQEIFI